MTHVDNPFESPSIISFCPGILGLERGVEAALGTKLRVAAYSEIETFIIENLMYGMEQGLLDPAPLWSDIKTFPAHYFRKKIHGLLGGYSCQPFSSAGKRKGKEDPRHIFPHILRHVDTIRPVWCFFENVTGHLSLGYDEVQYSLREIGYRVESGIYSAEEAGAPQERERLFILALADTFRLGETGIGRTLFGTSENDEGETQRQNGQRLWSGPIDSSSDELANAIGQGHQGSIAEESGWIAKLSGSGEQKLADTDSPWRSLRWYAERVGRIRKSTPRVAGRGQPQFGWEHPQLSNGKAEPPLGCTINGHNYREDFLRAIGNSVYAGCAEIGFLDLLAKHLQNEQR
jgi:DNA (cytosine-5)-methyltransferase 1